MSNIDTSLKVKEHDREMGSESDQIRVTSFMNDPQMREATKWAGSGQLLWLEKLSITKLKLLFLVYI